jgi:hypothetical protein
VAAQVAAGSPAAGGDGRRGAAAAQSRGAGLGQGVGLRPVGWRDGLARVAPRRGAHARLMGLMGHMAGRLGFFF